MFCVTDKPEGKVLYINNKKTKKKKLCFILYFKHHKRPATSTSNCSLNCLVITKTGHTKVFAQLNTATWWCREAIVLVITNTDVQDHKAITYLASRCFWFSHHVHCKNTCLWPRNNISDFDMTFIQSNIAVFFLVVK